jgi:ectoine hydroxylase-related dioxygenase (phytanoyl-CoA dioxygenase family)
MLSRLERDVFAIVHNVFEKSLADHLAREIDARLPDVPSAGIRGLAQKVEGVQAIARSPAVQALVASGLGPNSRLVRSIYFNKNASTNWQVAWHQDLAIAVREKSELDGFSSWSSKDGVTHVQPPIQILDRMLTIRLHLDPTTESNGALWVAPGSHRLGRIRASDAASAAERLGKHLCSLDAGDALLFKPLLLHASRKVTSTQRRRVIHLEFADIALPAPLQWSGAA